MGLKVGDYVKNRNPYTRHEHEIGIVLDTIINGNNGKSWLYTIEWIKHKGWNITRERRKDLEKISEKEAVIEML